MKDTHVLAAACGLALIAIVAVFIGYATGTLPQQKQRRITVSPQATTESPKEAPSVTDSTQKNCACCKKNIERFREHLDNLRKLEQATKTDAQTHTRELSHRERIGTGE